MAEARVTGLQLKLQRTARDVRAGDLADEMQVSASRISQIEGKRGSVTRETAERYLQALDKLAPPAAAGEDVA